MNFLEKAVPTVIKTEAENHRLLAIVEALLSRGEDHLTAEEYALLELLTGLIHDFESRTYPVPKSEPHEMVRYLIEQGAHKSIDLWPVIGSKGRVSEILSGRRAISKEQAKRLAEFFNVRVDLFISWSCHDMTVVSK